MRNLHRKMRSPLRGTRTFLEVGMARFLPVLKMRGIVEVVAPGSLPNDGLVIEDQRKYD